LAYSTVLARAVDAFSLTKLQPFWISKHNFCETTSIYGSTIYSLAPSIKLVSAAHA